MVRGVSHGPGSTPSGSGPAGLMKTLTVVHERAPSAPSHLSSVAVAQDRDATDWNRFVETCRDATAYHDWNWRTVFQSAFGHRCIYLIARIGDEIRGVLPLVQ